MAYEMNGEPLPLLHGGPLRLVVPRWYGMASTKWLTHVHARATESDNHFMARGYRYADGSAVDLMRVKSLITAPRDGEQVDVRYDAGDRRRLDGHRHGRAGRDLERRRSDLAAGTLHERGAARHVAPVGSRRGDPVGRRAARARARDRHGRTHAARAAPLRIPAATATTRFTRCASMRADAPTRMRRVVAPA